MVEMDYQDLLEHQDGMNWMELMDRKETIARGKREREKRLWNRGTLIKVHLVLSKLEKHAQSYNYGRLGRT